MVYYLVLDAFNARWKHLLDTVFEKGEPIPLKSILIYAGLVLLQTISYFSKNLYCLFFSLRNKEGNYQNKQVKNFLGKS